MDLYFDLRLRRFVTSNGTNDTVSALEFKRGDNELVVVRFCRGITLVELDGDYQGVLGMKATGDFDGDYLAHAASWTKEGTGTATTYTFELNLNTEALDELFGVGEAPDVASVVVNFEMEITDGEVVMSSNTIAATISNDVNRGTEGTPLANDTPDEWLSARAVRYDEAQALTDGQEQRARRNIGVTKKGIRLIETLADPEEEDPAPPMDAAWKILFPETAALYNGYKAFTATGEDFGETYTGKAALVGPHPSNEEIELCWRVAEFEDGEFVGYSGWYDDDSAEGVPPPEDIGDVTNWIANGSSGDLAGVEEVEEVPADLLPPVHVPLITIAGNVNDNAGLVMIGERLTLVLRHQTENTWHTLKIVDSASSPGTPTYEISEAL